MSQLKSLEHRKKDDINHLLKIWEFSVMKTHDFLTKKDLEALKPEVNHVLLEVENLICYYDEDGIAKGFMGIQEQKIEMLFIEENAMGQGIGRKLINYALQIFDIKYVDVNEQNIKGIGFYEHLGFQVKNRSETDGQGNPFPILHLEYMPL